MAEETHKPAFSPEQVGAWLKAARERADVTQAAAAAAIGSTVTSVSRWETGRHPITLEDFFALAIRYGGRDVIRRLSLMLGVSPTLLGLEVNVNQDLSDYVKRSDAQPGPILKVSESDAKRGRGRGA